MTGCCPKCGKDYFYTYLNHRFDELPDYMRIENTTVIITCQKCGTEFKFIHIDG